MFKVIKKPKTPNILWDASGNRPLCKFVKGIFETSDMPLVLKLKEMGYQVEGEPDVKPLDKMKVEELKAYAAEYNINLGEAVNKADILKTIQDEENKQQRW
ncbi:hypothetical protein AALA00_12100 [Lachnospiraceae bacterium 46-15]